ncbi:sugar ABC transporter permease [Nakamurella sp. A5-74]|uniref:Sugar ABC transporter permease n=1 Tax=Nakamurella sp. A5-74 TaxID=3158264 RepID=A0AAU8DLI4_9ACTN
MSAPAEASRPPRPVRGGSVTRRRWWVPILFVAPNMIVFGLFTIWPAINGFNISLFDSSNGRTFTPVGSQNYQEILSDPEFRSVVLHTLIFVVGFVIGCVLFGTVLALLLNAQRRGRGLLRAAYFLPVVISPVVVGLIWSWALTRQNGLVNAVLSSWGLGKPGWLSEPGLAMISVVGVGLWTHVGFYAMILLAGLQSIPANLNEAATIDGASAWQQIRRITLPLLRPTMLVVLVLATISGFQAFDYIYTLTGGGPVGATTLIVQYIYEKAFQSPIQYGLAAAGGVLFFVVVFAVTLINYFLGRRKGAV